MKRIKVTFDTWIQLLGMMGVLGGLVFVGLEMRQSQTIAVAGQTQARWQMLADFQLAQMEDQDIGRRLLAESTLNDIDPRSLNEDEYELFSMIHQWRMISIQNVYQQREMGLLPDDVWEQVRGRIESQWQNCHLRRFFEGVIPSLQTFIQSLPEECVSEYPK